MRDILVNPFLLDERRTVIPLVGSRIGEALLQDSGENLGQGQLDSVRRFGNLTADSWRPLRKLPIAVPDQDL